MRLATLPALFSITALAASLVVVAPASAADTSIDDAKTVRILTVGDFHGALNAAPDMVGEIRRLQAENENTIVLGTGDLTGWAQAESDLTRDEFALDILGDVPLAASALGNHEFDDGMAEAMRLVEGGCHPVDGCFDRDGDGQADEWEGAPFPYLAANIVNEHTGDRPFPGSVVIEEGGISIGVIGTVTASTPGHVGWEKFEGLELQDVADATNREAAELRAQGVDVLIAITHEGVAYTDDATCAPPYDGPLFEAARQITPDVDLILGGHYHRRAACNVKDPDGVDRMVVQPGSHATAVGVSDIVIDPSSGDVDREASASFVRAVDPEGAEDAGTREIVEQAFVEAERVGSAVVGRVSEDVMRPRNEVGGIAATESAVDNLVADAQLEWVNENVRDGADLAITSNWLTRGDLVFARSGDETEDGLITRRELWQAQIYDPSMLVVEMTGAEIEQMFQQQWVPLNRPKLGVSSNVMYVRDDEMTTVPRGATADRFVVDGELLDRDRMYRVAMNSILSRGIENYFPVFLDVGLDRRFDTEVSTAVPLAEYLSEHAPGNGGLMGRMPSPTDLIGHVAEPTLTFSDEMEGGRRVGGSVEVSSDVAIDGPVVVTISADPKVTLIPERRQNCESGQVITCTLDGVDGSITLDFKVRGLTPGNHTAEVTARVTGPFLERPSTTTEQVTLP